MELMETKNFSIRESEFKDYEAFYRMESDPEITRFLSVDSDRTYEGVVKDCFFNISLQTRKDFSVIDRETGQVAGRIFASRIDKTCDSMNITRFYMDKQYWGQGYGREVMREFLEYCFTFLHMERVTTDYYTGNKKAAALYAGMGFSGEGVARHATRKDGKYYDLHLVSILRSEFFGEND